MGILQIFTLLGALGMFLYGMNLMSSGLQKAAGDRLRGLLSAMTSNPLKGVLTGLGITSVIQSSSATTVMVVSFVNAGLLTLAQAIGVIMGANIGTTVTAWLVSWLGFKADISISWSDVVSTAKRYCAKLNVSLSGKESSVVVLKMNDTDPKRAARVIDALIEVYEEVWLSNKNKASVNTTNFINERLIIIERELGSVEQDLESYKVSNDMINLEATAGQAMTETTQHGANLIELETQLQYASYIRDYLTDPTKEIELIPANTGLSNMNIETQINQYNAMKLRRDKLIVDGNDSNPVIQELNSSLRAMKQTIIRAVDNLIANLEAKIKDTSSRETRAKARVRSIPRKERDMLSIERQQKIKEELYLYLLNKREENEIALNVVEGNARIIDPAYGSGAPVAPIVSSILLAALLLGLAVPLAILYVIEILNTTIRGRKDLEEHLSVPFLGEVPLFKGTMDHGIVVRDHSTDAVSEAMRIIRSNMTFMKAKSERLQSL